VHRPCMYAGIFHFFVFFALAMLAMLANILAIRLYFAGHAPKIVSVAMSHSVTPSAIVQKVAARRLVYAKTHINHVHVHIYFHVHAHPTLRITPC
jgi:hypothetical protein